MHKDPKVSASGCSHLWQLKIWSNPTGGLTAQTQTRAVSMSILGAMCIFTGKSTL